MIKSESEEIKENILDVLQKELRSLRHGQSQYKAIESALIEQGNRNATAMIAFYQKRIDYFCRAISILDIEL